MPKLDRYTIGQKVFELLLEIIANIMAAQYQHGARKKQTLVEISPKLNTIKILVRLTHSLDIIPQKQYISLEQELNEIGKMLGGWIKSL